MILYRNYPYLTDKINDTLTSLSFILNVGNLIHYSYYQPYVTKELCYDMGFIYILIIIKNDTVTEERYDPITIITISYDGAFNTKGDIIDKVLRGTGHDNNIKMVS